MYIHIERQRTAVRELHDLDRFWVATDVDVEHTGHRLRSEGIGYLDGHIAFVDTFWLRSLERDPAWLARLGERLVAADGHNLLHGVYLQAHVRPSSPHLRTHAWRRTRRSTHPARTARTAIGL
ncbi:hypothetical protein [Nocardia higoensis]|uniref:hypothetical protein n=1 Tax=Nocardia higoensis TaxID=228599 RepID=UPI0002E90A6E|nr:hypothetical protein [Nocardia higoensis]